MTAGAGSPGRTVVHLMRHGEVHNPTGVLYGRLPDFHLSDLGREMEIGQPAIEHAGGVVHLPVAHQVHDGPPGAPGASGHEETVASELVTARAAMGSAARTRSTAASSWEALTNHVSNALGGRCTPWLSMDWKNAEKACTSWALASS